MKIDLHSHSSASDGELSPAEAALHAFEKGISVWALTDHDTCSGLREAALVCAQKRITFIPGIEITIEWHTGEFHLLGLGLRRLSDELACVVEYLTENRKKRNQTIADKMNAAGCSVSLKEIEEEYAFSQLGRPHFADFMVKRKLVKSRQEAFDRFLGKGKPWYEKTVGENLETAVEAILSAGGVAVMAHPLSICVSINKIESTLAYVRSKGVEGIEAWHPEARVAEAERLEQMAKKLGMFVTAGSDFHGEKVRKDRRLGKTSGGRQIEARFWTEELKPRLGDFDFTKSEWANPR